MTVGAPACRLVARGRSLDLERPALMGIVNATPDSFSDGGRYESLGAQLDVAHELAAAGASILDLGGQSGITGVPEIPVAEEIRRVVPLVEAVRDKIPESLISVDTYRPAVVYAVLEAGAHIVNDISGLLYPDIADLCAAAGAGLVVMHTRARPKEKVLDAELYVDVTADVVAFLTATTDTATRRGVARDAIVVDPGPDFAKTPHQTVAVLRQLDQIRALGWPVLLALSRKDFVGAITGRPPTGRVAGTLGAIAPFAALPGVIFRVHDVRAVADYLQAAADLRSGP